MTLSKIVRAFFYTTAVCLWPMVTYAASVTLSSTLNSIPPSAWVIVFILATVSGLVSLLQRLKDEMMKPEGETRIRQAWRWFASAHLIGALFMGFVSFLIAESADIKDFTEAVFIAIFSYGGARAMDKMANGLTDGLINRVISFIGGTPPCPKGED